MRVEATLEVPFAAEIAFAAMVELASQDRWMIATTLTAMPGPVAPPAVGSRISARTGLGPLGFVDSMDVTGFEAGRRWEVLHTGRVIRGTGYFTAEPRGSDRSLLTWGEDLDLPLGWLGRIAVPVVRPVSRMLLLASLRRLAAGLADGSLPVRPAPASG